MALHCLYTYMHAYAYIHTMHGTCIVATVGNARLDSGSNPACFQTVAYDTIDYRYNYCEPPDFIATS